VGRPRRAESPEFGTSPVVPGFRIEGPAIQRDRWQQGEDVVDVRWEVLAHDALRVRVGDAEHRVRVHEQRGDTLDITADGVRTTWRCAAAGPVVDGAVVYVHLGDAEAVMQLVPRFPAPASPADEPGTSTAPTPGVVTRVHVAVGDVVEKGALLLTLEAMKMEHRMTAASGGTVAELRVQPGESVDAGAVLVRISEA
jgi:propionyl-CoA carboxylase alpha chain